jgi:hypothetical protein
MTGHLDLDAIDAATVAPQRFEGTVRTRAGGLRPLSSGMEAGCESRSYFFCRSLSCAT